VRSERAPFFIVMVFDKLGQRIRLDRGHYLAGRLLAADCARHVAWRRCDDPQVGRSPATLDRDCVCRGSGPPAPLALRALGACRNLSRI